MTQTHSNDPTRIAETFFGHWNANRIDDALAMLSDDVLYDNVPLPSVTRMVARSACQ